MCITVVLYSSMSAVLLTILHKNRFQIFQKNDIRSFCAACSTGQYNPCLMMRKDVSFAPSFQTIIRKTKLYWQCSMILTSFIKVLSPGFIYYLSTAASTSGCYLSKALQGEATEKLSWRNSSAQNDAPFSPFRRAWWEQRINRRQRDTCFFILSSAVMQSIPFS